VRIVLASALGGGFLLVGGPAALAQEAAPSSPQPVDLATIMSGEGSDVLGNAVSGVSDDGSFAVKLTVHNATDQAVRVDVPFGTMFLPADESQQTVVTSGPRDATLAVSAKGDAPAFVAPPGDSTHELVAFCGQQFDHSPQFDVPVTYGGVAKAPLPTVLANIAAQEPPMETAQDAVWWVTNEPSLPIDDPGVAALLGGVDTVAFAAHPVKVVAGPEGTRAVPVTAILPAAGRFGLVLTTLAAALVVVALAVVAHKGRKRAPAAVVGARSGYTAYNGGAGGRVGGGPPAGWYSDPWAPGWRYWDGRRWTAARR
jgi:hypothetical protein